MAIRVFLAVNPSIDLDRDGLEVRAPNSAARLARLCQQWAADLGVELADRAGDADVALRVPSGRGVDGYLWALRHAAWTAAWPPQVVRYGPGDDHVGDLRVPAGDGPHPVAVLLHGGFWYDVWRRDLMDGIATDLARRGWVTWNVEYRRLGAGGGWPQTGADVLAALDHVARLAGVDAGRVTLVGHSAGGQLALWAAAERAVQGVVALAPVADLALAVRQRLGGGAAAMLLGAVAAGAASPVERVPTGTPVLLVHAPGDAVVPVEHSRRYAAAAAAAGDQVRLLEPAGADHMSLVDPDRDWRDVAARLDPEAGSSGMLGP